MTLPVRISKRIVPSSDTGCWEWAGTRNTHGYGMVWLSDRMYVTHRVVYEALVGPVPEGLELDHLCQNKGCCNPAHLEPVTHGENGRRTPESQRRRSMTHCLRGHEFTPETTYITKLGRRRCRPCRTRTATNDRKAQLT